MLSLGIHHVAVNAHAAGVEAVAQFYLEVVGLPELSRQTKSDGRLRSVWLSLSASGDPAAGFLAVEEGAHFGPAMVALKIHAADRRVLLARLYERKVVVVKETRWTVYVEDPAGNRVAFSHHPHDPL